MRLADEQGTFRLLCFDFDAKIDEPETAADDCDALSTLLTTHNIPHLVCESSASGGRHIWIAPQGGLPARATAALATAARAHYRSLDHGMLLNAREGAARPPLSPHRNGSHSRVLRGAIDSLLDATAERAALTALTAALEDTAPNTRTEQSSPSGPTNDHRPHRKLTAWGQSHMATVRGGSNPSWTGFMCLLAAATAGWTTSDIEHAARTAPGMEHYRTKNTGRGTRRPRATREATERLHRQWVKAQEIASFRSSLPADTRINDLTQLDTIMATAQALLQRLSASPGRWGRTEAAVSERSVLLALTYLSVHTGKTTVGASIRDLALLAGIGRTTVNRALATLTADGWIETVRTADGPNAREFRVTPDFSTPSDKVRSQPPKNPRPPGQLFSLRTVILDKLTHLLTDGRHDLFTRAGYGHTAGRVYAELRDQVDAITVDGAARLLGLDRRTAATALSRLRHSRLVIKRGSGWVRSVRDLRDAAARAIGVLGTLAARARRYALEREVWAWWLAEYDTMHSSPRQRATRPHVSARPLFRDDGFGERTWPRYPRSADGLANHREARHYVEAGYLRPGSRWTLGDVA
ncbi:GntR family transcriptional regulator [Herbiconiux sp. VKM Ac-2851]|uniref:GntR family transcriptional regulator n=1 Tax=Herbiconiux sp. VKM Ac-2851 TaxID=2739025 RepID=UPI0020B1354C|nr:GntR family transcriptional regulator [Herbiconiux sp. VKM Ac-2851]